MYNQRNTQIPCDGTFRQGAPQHGCLSSVQPGSATVSCCPSKAGVRGGGAHVISPFPCSPVKATQAGEQGTEGAYGVCAAPVTQREPSQVPREEQVSVLRWLPQVDSA